MVENILNSILLVLNPLFVAFLWLRHLAKQDSSNAHKDNFRRIVMI